MIEREFFKTFYDYDEDDLNTKSIKTIFVKNTIITNIIKNCKGEKKEVYGSIEHKVKSKIGKIFEEYSVKIYEIDPYFSEHYKKKIQVDKNGQQYILFRIDIYFSKYGLAVEINEKGHTDRDLTFEQKRQDDALEKKLDCTFIRFNTSKENFDVDCETSRTQTFISQFKDNKINERDNKNKELENVIEKLKLQLVNLGVKNNEFNDEK